MHPVLKALIGASRNIFHPVVLGVLLLPMVGAVIAWFGIAWFFWDAWTAWIQAALSDAMTTGWGARLDLTRFAGAAATVILLLLLAPAIIGTATLLAALFAMPVLVEHVAGRDHPTLARYKGGTFFGSLWNAGIALGGFALLWLATLPAWLIVGPLAAVLQWVLSAWLNDALSEHASAAEMQRLFETRFGALIVLGLITGSLYFVPLVNLMAPVFAALAFTQFGLAELEALRAAEKPVDGERLA
jgi:CysZ protein